MTMTVSELRELLEGYDDDTEVRLAEQPAWAFEFSLSSAVALSSDESVLYLSEGQQLGYLPGWVPSKLGWS